MTVIEDLYRCRIIFASTDNCLTKIKRHSKDIILPYEIYEVLTQKIANKFTATAIGITACCTYKLI